MPVEWLSLRDRILEQQETGFPMDIRELAVNGSDVMRILGIPPGETVGRVLGHLHERHVEDARKGTHEETS